MTNKFPPPYLRHRLLEERELAKSAPTVAAREGHGKLAAFYQEELASFEHQSERLVDGDQTMQPLSSTPAASA